MWFWIIIIVSSCCLLYLGIGMTQVRYYKALILRSGGFEGGPEWCKEVAYWIFSLAMGPFILCHRWQSYRLNLKVWKKTGIWIHDV